MCFFETPQDFVISWSVITLRLRQNWRHFADNIFKCIFLNENVWISLNISLKCVPNVWISNTAALVQIMARCRPAGKPLSEPMMVKLRTHICIARALMSYNMILDMAQKLLWQAIMHALSCFKRPLTVYPKKYAHGFVVLCFVVVMQSFIMNSHEVFIHIHQGCFAGTGAIVRLPQCQWSKPDGYGKISQFITTTKHSKAKTVCILLGIYCTLPLWGSYVGIMNMNKLVMIELQWIIGVKSYHGYSYSNNTVQLYCARYHVSTSCLILLGILHHLNFRCLRNEISSVGWEGSCADSLPFNHPIEVGVL